MARCYRLLGISRFCHFPKGSRVRWENGVRPVTASIRTGSLSRAGDLVGLRNQVLCTFECEFMTLAYYIRYSSCRPWLTIVRGTAEMAEENRSKVPERPA